MPDVLSPVQTDLKYSVVSPGPGSQGHRELVDLLDDELVVVHYHPLTGLGSLLYNEIKDWLKD